MIFTIVLNVVVATIAFNIESPSLIVDQLFPQPGSKDVKAFSSEEDFKNYLANIPIEGSYFGRGISMMGAKTMSAPAQWRESTGFGAPEAPAGISNDQASYYNGKPDRFSQTNVQVAGIDEPDIVKTDGKEIYFSSDRYWVRPMTEPMMKDQGVSLRKNNEMMLPDIMPPVPIEQPGTSVIKAFPAGDLAIDGKINKRGDLLLNKNILMVFGGQEITGFDVSNSKSPAQKWNVKINDNNSIVSSRLYNDKIYLVTRNAINESRPCLISPLAVDGMPVNIRCQEIYHPINPVPVDAVFSAMILNPANGKIEKTVSFVGSSSTSTVYMSENSLYITYSYSESIIKFYVGFFKANQDLFPASLTKKLERLDSYEISDSSKLNEFTTILQKYSSSLSKDENLKLQNEMQNRMSEYYKLHRRELEKTGIAKIDLKGFKVTAVGSVPGYLLNQFALDEYNGNLRVATTIGRNFGWGMGISGQNGTTNDVYVFDKNMKNIGSVKDFGKTEQIYSVRFVGDKGYVVTFRQTDPFYVMDLSNPKDPKIAGELKIPGFSSYLHPLDETHILGVGMENGKVKISLFDVSDKNNPTEIDKYSLDEYWTDVSNNYHAFMIDKKHKVFFLPGGKGGYVFSYFKPVWAECVPDNSSNTGCKNFTDKLELKKAVSQISAKRAIYINDYLYIIGDEKITVLNESDWEKVNELEF